MHRQSSASNVICHNILKCATVSDPNNVLLVRNQNRPCLELWTEQSSAQQMEQILGMNSVPYNGQTMSLDDIEQHCPRFSTLQIPYVLDSKLSNVQLKKIAVGSVHCLFLTEEGFVYGMGQNSFGQLLSYDQDHSLHRGDVIVPTLLLWFVEHNIRIRDIACAGWFSAFVSTDGELYTVGRFGSNSTSTNEPVLRSKTGFVSTFGVGLHHLLFQYDSKHGDQVYSLGSNSYGQLGCAKGVDYADDAVEVKVDETLVDPPKPFNFCRLAKIHGGTNFTVVLTIQSDVFAAGLIRELSSLPTLANNGFTKLDLSRLGTALVRDFSCSWYDTVFVDSTKRVFTSSSLHDTDDILWKIDASFLANPVVTARARAFHVVDTCTGRLFNLIFNNNSVLKLEDQIASLDFYQMLDHPQYQVASYSSGYYINMVLLKSTSSKTSLRFFMTNLKRCTLSHSIFSDVEFVFE